MTNQPVNYKYTSTKEWHDAFPCAYRQWRADSHCNQIHGYSFTIKVYFGADTLDARNWCADYGGLKDLKAILEDQFDHTLLVAEDDPDMDMFKLLQERGMAKLTIIPATGCEALADMVYKFINGVYIPDHWGSGEAERLWCYRVEVRETQSNMAFREGHREWNEDLFADNDESATSNDDSDTSNEDLLADNDDSVTNKKHSIAVLLPTRGRTTSLDKSVYSIIDNAADPDKIELLFGFDDDDTVGLDHFSNHLLTYLDQKKINFKALKFDRMGYININKYYNELAKFADADWLFIWNDDAFMDTPNWDQVVQKYDGQFKVLKVHTHNEHPYSIFPIVPAAWTDLLGYLSGHQMIDAWISQIAYLIDLIEIVDINVTHDRYDLTGNNSDDTFVQRACLEGNPGDPEDFHHPNNIQRLDDDCRKLANYLKSQGYSIDWWENVQAGTQYPWEKLELNDINKQQVQFNYEVNGESTIISIIGE